MSKAVQEVKEEKPIDQIEEPKKTKPIKIIFRLLISVVFLVALIKYGKVDIGEAFKHLLTVNPFYFGLGFICYLITLCVAGSRFFMASNALGFRKNWQQCVQLNFVGTFFNNFLPTTFGGDALRGYYLKRGTDLSLTKAAACVLCERYAGMVVLFWMCSAVFIFRRLGMIDKSIWDIPLQMELFSHAGTFASVFVVPFLPRIKVLLFGKENWLYKKIEPVLVYWHDLKLIGKIFSLSMVLQAMVVLSHIFIAKSLNLEIPMSYYFVFYPLTTIAGFLIPSLNGLGVREGTYIFFLSKIGIETAKGMAFSISFLIMLLATSIIGGLVYMFGDFRKNITA